MITSSRHHFSHTGYLLEETRVPPETPSVAHPATYLPLSVQQVSFSQCQHLFYTFPQRFPVHTSFLHRCPHWAQTFQIHCTQVLIHSVQKTWKNHKKENNHLCMLSCIIHTYRFPGDFLEVKNMPLGHLETCSLWVWWEKTMRKGRISERKRLCCLETELICRSLNLFSHFTMRRIKLHEVKWVTQSQLVSQQVQDLSSGFLARVLGYSGKYDPQQMNLLLGAWGKVLSVRIKLSSFIPHSFI